MYERGGHVIEAVIFALWFFLPAGLANVAPVFSRMIPGLTKLSFPIDGGKSWRGKRILGNNKTWRGLLSGILIGVLTLAFQKYLYSNVLWLQLNLTDTVDYFTVSLWLGALLGFGALAGDAFESFAKRQLSIPSGKSWFPFDQLDYIIGGLLAASFITTLSFTQSITIMALWFGMHLFWTYVGYLIGVREDPI